MSCSRAVNRRWISLHKNLSPHVPSRRRYTGRIRQFRLIMTQVSPCQPAPYQHLSPQYMDYSPQPGVSHQIPYHTPSPHPQYHQSSTQPPPDQQKGFDPAYLSAPPPSTHQVVRPRPQRDRRPSACGTSSHLHPHPAQDSDQS
ncbi:hypothetical protein PIB30_028620 [Stylosanthes scabra]|uniref:Uncharacterized protein n=1 Tax=Stylosanthes scabra TaxID=79078 RepID=A0ABU6YBA9_9FABA|nr:hypothetical protein [Stylosanthes scabra]